MNQARLEKTILWALLVLLVAGLLYFSFLGIYNRYWADDWCYVADLADLGLSGALAGYTSTTAYAASRFSLTLFTGLLDSFGILGLQIMTLLVIVAGLYGLYRLLEHADHFLNLDLPPTIWLTLSALVVYFSIYIAPHRYQSFYYRAALLPYTAPLLATLWLIVLLLDRGRLQAGPTQLPLISLLAFFGAAFSEAGSALMLTALILLLVATRMWRSAFQNPERLRKSLLVAFGLALLASLIMVVAPTAAERVSRYGAPAGFVEFWTLTLRYSWDFVRFSLAGLPLPHAVVALIAALLGFMAVPRNETRTWQARNVLLAVMAVSLVAYLLIAASYAPSALIEHNPPHPRTRVIARSMMLLVVAAAAWLVGRWAAANKSLDRARPPLLLLLGLGLSFYLARSLYLSAGLQPVYASRAQIWDQRDLQLRAAAETGQSAVVVAAIDGQPVGHIVDFKESKNYYVNACAARYYGVGDISALP